MREECGVLGIYNKIGEDIAKSIYEGLIALQHRGQESAGIAVSNGKNIYILKGLGYVSEALRMNEVSRLNGFVGIGHVRYSTTGESLLNEAQPIIYPIDNKNKFSLAFNGTITNYHILKKGLLEEGYKFDTNTDTEVLAAIISRYWRLTHDYFETLKHVIKILKGAYSLVMLTDKGELYIMRDPLGFKPLVIGYNKKEFIAASESVAIDVLHGKLDRDVNSGEILRIIDGKVSEKYIFKVDRKAHCMFEYIYFSRPDSIINGINVYEVRYRLGEILAELYPVEADIIVPVPDTGVIAALGYSNKSDIPIAMGLIRNPYVGRSFIKPTQSLREFSVQLKMGIARSEMRGKRVILIDDSIVRGTTIKWIVSLLRKADAREVHVRITCPPIKYPCYMGIDFPMRRELIASNHSIEEIRKIIGADSLGYMTIEGLIEAIGLGRDNLCLACLTGEYPIEKGEVSILEKVFGGRR